MKLARNRTLLSVGALVALAISSLPRSARAADPSDAGIRLPNQMTDAGTLIPKDEDARYDDLDVIGLQAEVKGQREHYVVKHTESSRTDTPIAEQPNEVQVIPQEVMQDQAAFTLKQVAKDVSGVTIDKTEGNAIDFEEFLIRGLPNAAIYRDNMLVIDQGTFPLEMAERVEVVKGPTSLNFGQQVPGGFINIISKTPKMAPALTVAGSYDRFGAWNAWADGTGGVSTTNAGDFAGRIVGGYDRTFTFREGDSGYRTFFDPGVTWRPDHKTELTVFFTYTRQRYTLDDGIPFINKQPALPITTYLNDSRLPGATLIDSGLNVHFRETFNDHIEWNSRLRYGYYHDDLNAERLQTLTPATGMFSQSLSSNHLQDKSWQMQNDVAGKFDTGFLHHRVTIGFDGFHTNTLNKFSITPNGSINIDDPTIRPAYAKANPLTQSVTNGQQLGIFGTEELRTLPDDALHLVAGVRYDAYQTDLKAGSVSIVEHRLSQGHVTWRAGALYDIVKDVGIYGSYSTSFNPVSPTSVNFNQTPLDPVTAYQWETGAKAGLFENRLLFTADYFLIMENNLVVTDPAHAGFSINGGRIHSGGVEADVVGTPMPGLNIIGQLTDMRTKVLASTSLPVGGQLREVPKFSTSLFGKYTLQTGPLRGLGVGAGISGVTQREVDDANDFELPGYVTVDATASYEARLQDHLVTFQLNITNLTNRVYWESSIAAGKVMPGRPIDAIGTVRAQF